MQNLRNHTVPNTLTFKENAISWFHSLLLNQTKVDDLTGSDNVILIAYGMCHSVELMGYYQMNPEHTPTHFMQGMAGVVQANVGQKLLNCYPLRVFSGDR
jgi:hypothetical protein